MNLVDSDCLLAVIKCYGRGGVPELADGHDLGSCAARRRGSSPRFPTILTIHISNDQGVLTNKVGIYREKLKILQDWEPYLLAESELPGPRGNLELAAAVYQEGDAATFERLLRFTPDKAPANAPEEFLHFCGVFGLGKTLSQETPEIWERLRQYAGDPRWRTREAVAMALQSYGDRDMEGLLDQMGGWAKGNRFEQRAAAAGLCEPRPLKQAAHSYRVLQILDIITSSIAAANDRKDEAFRVLRQALGYCWSVAVAAFPEVGKAFMEKWMASKDHDVQRIMKDNLSKNRLIKMDADWVERQRLVVD